MRLLIPLLALELLSVKGFCGPSQTISINPDKRLKAVISSDSMNRLAVANDRITQIFGDQDTYEVQTEESTGQLFLKPSLENGKKPLSITLITENGLTQDMTLEPVERDAATVILKNTEVSAGTGNDTTKPNSHLSFFQTSEGFGQGYVVQGFGQQMPGFGAALGFQDQVIAAMKFLVSGSAPTIGIDNFDRKGPKGIEIGLIEAVNLGNFKGYKLDVKNAGDVPMDILEKDFYQSGDLAFSFERRMLNPKTSTVLYVVTRV
jgi:type-F conjugative transfer system secretin TraK